MVEEWKARRKEWKKKRWKKGNWEKSGFGRSPFCFCLTVCLHLPPPFFFPAPTTPPHQNTCSHIPATHHTTRRIVEHHHMQTGPCAVLPFLGNGQQDTLHHPHPTLHHLTSHNTHQPTQHRHTAHGANNNGMTVTNEKGNWTKGQKWDNTAAPTH